MKNYKFFYLINIILYIISIYFINIYKNYFFYIYLINTLLLIISYFITRKKSFLEKKNIKKSLIKIIIISLINAIISIILQTFFLNFESKITKEIINSQNTKNILKLITNDPYFIIIVIIFGPITEEIIFRYSILNIFIKKFGFFLTSIIGSILFSFIHRDGHYFTYFLTSLFFFHIYKKNKSIYFPILTHCLINTFVVFINLIK